MSCFIPKTSSKYESVNFAYVSFANEEDQNKAHSTYFNLSGNKLTWCQKATKTCHECGSPSHLYNNCDKRKKWTRRDENLRKIYAKYRPANHRQPPRSYAEAAGRNIPRGSKQQQSIQNGTHAGGSMHSHQNPKQKKMNILETKFKRIETDLKGVMLAINQLKDAIKHQPTQQSTSKDSNKPPIKAVKTHENSSKRTITEANLSGSSDEETVPASFNLEAAVTDIAKKVLEIESSVKDSKKELTQLQQEQEIVNDTYGYNLQENMQEEDIFEQF
jgi:hypothetical protein